MKPTKTILLAVLAIVAVAMSSQKAVAQAQVFTFDDLPAPGINTGSTVPAIYDGLQWQNFGYVDGVGNSFLGIPNGYANAVVSANNVAFNVNSNPATLSGSAFNLSSAYLTGAWRDGLQVEVQGYVGATLTYDNIYTVNTSGPTLLDFDYLGVDKVIFSSSGGTLNPNFHDPEHNTPAEQFAMDDLTINAAPEPSSFALVGLAGTLLAFRRFRRRCAS